MVTDLCAGIWWLDEEEVSGGSERTPRLCSSSSLLSMTSPAVAWRLVCTPNDSSPLANN
jgi:hypothetical protein